VPTRWATHSSRVQWVLLDYLRVLSGSQEDVYVSGSLESDALPLSESLELVMDADCLTSERRSGKSIRET